MKQKKPDNHSATGEAVSRVGSRASNKKGVRFPAIRPGMVIGDATPSKTDVLGSWTGVPADASQPVQDADDL